MINEKLLHLPSKYPYLLSVSCLYTPVEQPGGWKALVAKKGVTPLLPNPGLMKQLFLLVFMNLFLDMYYMSGEFLSCGASLMNDLQNIDLKDYHFVSVCSQLMLQRQWCAGTHSSASGLRLRSLERTDLRVRRMRTYFSDREFSAAGPQCWNSLTPTIPLADSVESFKAQLKTHLFVKYSHI